MFPECSGVYMAQRDDDLFVVKVKGVYPTLQLDKKAIDLGEYLKNGKTVEVPNETLDNMELFHEKWDFHSLDFIHFGVFSKNEFVPNGTELFMSEDECVSLRNKYFRLCQQGVPVTKVIRALSYEFKVSKDQIIDLINAFDGQACISD